MLSLPVQQCSLLVFGLQQVAAHILNLQEDGPLQCALHQVRGVLLHQLVHQQELIHRQGVVVLGEDHGPAVGEGRILQVVLLAHQHQGHVHLHRLQVWAAADQLQCDVVVLAPHVAAVDGERGEVAAGEEVDGEERLVLLPGPAGQHKLVPGLAVQRNAGVNLVDSGVARETELVAQAVLLALVVAVLFQVLAQAGRRGSIPTGRLLVIHGQGMSAVGLVDFVREQGLVVNVEG